jgi:hypoxanthine phosphoribosyltransferase
MAEKEFVRADDQVRDSFVLAKQIFDSGFVPDVLLVLWRGGTPVGIVIHEFLLYKGISTYQTVLKAESYVGIDQRKEPVIEHIESLLSKVDKTSRVLVVDDIFDSGCTMKKVRELLSDAVAEIRIATLYYKPASNTTDIVPDYYVRQTDRWIVFPHELMDLSDAEIRAKDGVIADLLK